MGTTDNSARYRFGIVGAGWRAMSYLRVARAMPEHFQVSGIITRNTQRADEVSAEWGVVAQPTLEGFLGVARPDFMVLAVPRSVTVRWLMELIAARLPVLCETPPAADMAELKTVAELVANGARVQVAEQYQYQPIHAARLVVTDGGLIGDVSMAYLSVAHDYHAFSLARRHLRVVDEPALLRANVLRTKVEAGFGKSGPRRAVGAIDEVRIVGTADFDGRLALYDFSEEQYFSYVRSPQLAVRASRGEITGCRVRRLAGLDEPLTMDLRREETGRDGDLGGCSLRGISMGGRWVYRNPFAGARLADDEIAVATCLELMGHYSEGGQAFYGLADAAQDQYLALCLRHAAASGEAVRAVRQPWSGVLLGPGELGGDLPQGVLEDHGTSRPVL